MINNYNFDENNENHSDNFEFNNDYKEKERRAYRQIIFTSIIFLFSLNFIAPFLANFISQEISGILMILAVSISLIPVFLLMDGKNKLGELKIIRKKMTFSNFLFLFGLMFLSSIIFVNLTNIIVEIFNIQSVDVTQIINDNLNFNLFIYAVIFAPIMEEFQFRGLYLEHGRKYSSLATILIVSICFSFMHGNFIQSIGTIGMSLVISYVGYSYGFVYAVLFHFINNLYATIVSRYIIANPESGLAMFVGMAILMLILVTAGLLIFNKSVKDEIKENLGLAKEDTDKEKNIEGLKNLITDPVFYIYIIVFIALSVLEVF